MKNAVSDKESCVCETEKAIGRDRGGLGWINVLQRERRCRLVVRLGDVVGSTTGTVPL